MRLVPMALQCVVLPDATPQRLGMRLAGVLTGCTTTILIAIGALELAGLPAGTTAQGSTDR